MTHEDNIPRKKLWQLKKSRSDPHLGEERGRGAVNNTSPLPPLRDESRGRSPGRFLFPKFFAKVPIPFRRGARSARQSPNPQTTAATSSAQRIPLIQTTQDPSPLVAPTPDPNPEQSSNSGVAEVMSTNVVKEPDPKFVNDTIADAAKGVTSMNNVAKKVQSAASATGNLQSVPDPINQFSAIIGTLKTFQAVADQIANLHPYAKVVLGILTQASKMIIDQANLDSAVSDLLSKVSDVYDLVTEKKALANISSMMKIYTKIAEHTLKCAEFIVHYSETKGFSKRLVGHVFKDTDAEIRSYSDILDVLMQQFRDQVTRDTAIILDGLDEDRGLRGMECAVHAGLDTSKCCLPNTRNELLTEIKSWIGSTGEDVPRVLWLSGTAGKGKSAIAHTIANWSEELGGLGACFCFDRTQVAERRHEKIFTTIARDLADCNVTMRKALARALHNNSKLKRTLDISRQWQELVIGPIGEASKAISAPVLIIIEALDESGEAHSREQILRLLAGKLNTSTSQLAELPANFRILVTSRPLEDISHALHTPSHVRHISLDNVSSASTEHDIQLYISTRLEDLHDVFNDTHFETLAQKSDGLFEWARLTCEYIKGTGKVRLHPMNYFEAVITGTSAKGTRLLDDMYKRILADSMPEDERDDTMPLFRSVMGQILASSEPLPMAVLTAMRMHFPCVHDRYDVRQVIGSLGALLNGTTDSQTPIRPLHASFYDFLTDKLRSPDFFVDASAAQSDLAFASLRVMDSEGGLRFNICSLENSYFPNSSVPDLEKRIKEFIPAELSYSCRFWGIHVAAASFEAILAKEVEAFFDGERLLWWLEALALMKNLRGSVDSLLSVRGWVMGHAECVNISDAATDTLRFVRTFAPTILRSTPHLYVSALPFAPTQSRIFRNFAAKFPHTPRIVAGHVAKWPQMEKILHANGYVYSVAMSPDGKRIACGLDDFTIQVWDTETGEALCAPLRGHTHIVASVAFSPDGKHIVSGSWDCTVRVWDAVTGKALGSPLKGHTKDVRSVAISSNGNTIVSGSKDKTVRVWDAVTGKALGSPLIGHTEYVTSVAISSKGNKIVSGSCDKTIRVWDMETGEAFGHPLEGHTDYVRSVAISQDGKHIVSGSNDKTVRVWDMETGGAFGHPLEGHTDHVRSVAISQDGKHIVSGSNDKTVRLWDMETGEALGAPLQGHTAFVLSVTISSDENRIVSSSDDQTIRVWDLKTGEALGSPLQSHTNSVLSIPLSPYGNHIVSGSDDNTIRVWGAGTIVGKASLAALQSHADSVNSIAISPNGKCIVSGSDDRTVRVWDMATGEALVAPLQGHTDSVLSVAISPDGKQIVSGSKDTTIWVWDMGTGEALSAPLQGHTTTPVDSIAISSDGTCIVSGSSDMIQVYNTVESGKLLCTPLQLEERSRILPVAISPDRNCIVSGSGSGTIWIWNAETGKSSGASLQGHTDWVRSVTVSPDAKCVVSGSDDETVRVWDIGTGKALASLRGHTGWVRSVALSQNGQRIVSGSDDETIRVWDMKTGEAVGAPFRGHTSLVMSVAISPDGKHVVSGSRDKTIRVWDLEFLHQRQLFEASAICFSHDPSHALHSALSFLSDSEAAAPYGPNEEGWVVGPEGRLLLWIPRNFHPVMYAPGNVLVIPNNALQLDLSRVAHGTSWHECRTQEAGSSS